MSLSVPVSVNLRNWCIRIIPKPPSLRRTPARIMEPATGASTWALGSQRWTEYMGNFTKKAPNAVMKIKLDKEGDRGGWVFSDRRLGSSIYSVL